MHRFACCCSSTAYEAGTVILQRPPDLQGPVAHSNRTHSKLAASAAWRWTSCLGSVEACGDIPDAPSPYAKKGTAAHQVAEWCWHQKRDAASFVGTVIDGEAVTPVMAAAVRLTWTSVA